MTDTIQEYPRNLNRITEMETSNDGDLGANTGPLTSELTECSRSKKLEGKSL